MSKAKPRAERPPKAVKPAKPARVKATHDKQRVKLLMATPQERMLLDRMLASGLNNEPVTLDDGERDVAMKLKARSDARRW